MAISVVMKNPASSELKQIRIGFSWVLFLFSGLLIPLFRRSLKKQAMIFVGLWVLYILSWGLGIIPVALALNLTFCVLQLWLGIKGNEMTLKNYMKQGWVFSDPDSDATRFAKIRMGLSGAATAA